MACNSNANSKLTDTRIKKRWTLVRNSAQESLCMMLQQTYVYHGPACQPDNFTTALFFTISDGQDQDRLYPISRYINFCVMVITAN